MDNARRLSDQGLAQVRLVFIRFRGSSGQFEHLQWNIHSCAHLQPPFVALINCTDNPCGHSVMACINDATFDDCLLDAGLSV